jgi:DNA-binding transcriptional LysR family regulator
MELRHLRYFIAVAEEKHMTRAAERLGIQQPPLSMQIRSLEQELDVQLFRRQPRGVELTDAGVAFLDRARVILDQVDRALATTRRTARGEQGRVVVGFTSSAPFHPFVPRVIRAFREISPLVSLVLEESGSSELVQGLHNEEIDAAFIRSPVADVVGLTVRPLLQERMVVALPKGHSLAGGGRKRKATQSRTAPLPLAELATETFILYKRPGGPGLYDTIITACRGAGFSPHVGQEAPRIISTLNLVAAGLGVSLVPESLRRLQMDGVVYRKLADNAQLTAPLILACRRGENAASVQRFIDLVQSTAEHIDAESELR